jgi:putative transcriptional regulator
MAAKPRYRSDAFGVIHASATALHDVGAIDKATLREFDLACIAVPTALAPEEIKALRESQHVSQPVFAHYLNTSASTVQKWESGAKRPSGLAVKLLTVVRKHGLQVLV